MHKQYAAHSLNTFLNKFQYFTVVRQSDYDYICFQDNTTALTCLNSIKELLNNATDIEDIGLAKVVHTPQHMPTPYRFRLYPKQLVALEKMSAQASASTLPSTLLTQLPLAPPLAPPLAQLNIIKPKIVPERVNKIPVKAKYFIKALRADENWYTDAFFRMITQTESTREPLPLRPQPKKAFTVTGKGVIERAKKEPLYSKEAKKPFSKHCSTTLVTDKVLPPAFGHTRDNRRDKLVGVMIDLEDALINRFFIYDGGTVSRPYDFDNKKDADEYFETKVRAKEAILFDNQAAFENAIAKRKNGKAPVYNEVLARLRWNLNGSSKIFIGSDTLEARLLAQEYARLLLNRLREQAKENGLELNKNYYVPICFYLPDNLKKHATFYDSAWQEKDIALALSIHCNAQQRAEKYAAKNYEFLLAHPRPVEIFKEIHKGESLIQKMLQEGYVHIVQNLLERALQSAKLSDILESVLLNATIFNSITFNHVAQAGNILLMEWLLTKPLLARSHIEIGLSCSSVLIAACLRGHAKIVDMLLTARVSTLQQETNGDRLGIEIAVQTKRWDIVKIFLKHAVLPGAVKSTPRELDCYKLLLKHVIENIEVDIDVIMSLIKLDSSSISFRSIKIKNDYLLHWALKNNKSELVRLLVKNATNLEEINENNQTVIEYVAANQRWDMVEVIANARKTTHEDKARYGTALLEAVKHNQISVVAALLAANTSAQQICLLTNRNLLELATECGYDAIKKLLIDSINGKALLSAVITNSSSALKTVKTLAEAGASTKNACLFWAINNANDAMVSLLLQYNADLEWIKPNTVETPIEFAAKKKRWSTIKIIARYKQTDREDKAGYGKALLIALSYGEAARGAVIELIKAKAAAADFQLGQNNADGSPLFWAIYGNDAELVKLLVTHGADLTLCNKARYTPLEEAWNRNKFHLVKIIAEGRKTNAEDKAQYFKVLLHAIRSQQLEIVRALISAGAPVNQTVSSSGYTLLQYAIQCNNRKDNSIVKFLLEQGADLKCVLRHPIKMAAELSEWDLVEVIALHKKADQTDLPIYGEVMLKAVQQANYRVASALLDAGALVDTIDPSSGGTALHLAIKGNVNDFIIHLLKCGANPTIVDFSGMSPIKLACQLGMWHHVITLAEGHKTDSKDNACYKGVLHAALAANQIATMRALLQASVPFDNTVLAQAVATKNQEAVALLQQYALNWSNTAKSELLAKYTILRSLQDNVLSNKWSGEKVIFSALGFTLFSKSAPSGIQQLQQALSALPVEDIHLERDWFLVETIYLECHKILSEKQQPYQGVGARGTNAADFYRDAFAACAKLEPLKCAPAQFKK